MKFLIDGFSPADTSSIVEAVTTSGDKGQKKYYIKGVFAQAETKNRNGRMYPRKSMEKAIEEYGSLIKAKRALGEMMHPDHPNVNLERASHLVESLEWSGNDVIGKARILTEMPMGKIAKGLIDEGVQLGVSTRGMGSIVEKNGVNVVQDDFMMSAIDIVGDPSAPNAFVEGIMEGKEWVYNASSKSWMLAEQLKSDIKKMTASRVVENQARMFQDFLNGLN